MVQSRCLGNRCFSLSPPTRFYNLLMLHATLKRATARLLIGTLGIAFVLLSLPMGAAAAPAADGEAASSEHCQPVSTPAPLLCKHHCQSQIQTLDHPQVDVPTPPAAALLTVSLVDLTIGLKPLVGKALRPDAVHHGGAPPLFASTARLRI